MLRVGNLEIAEDISHESFLKFANYLINNEVDSPKALIYTICRGVIVDYFRIKNRVITVEDIEEMEVISDEDVRLEIDNRELWQEIEYAINNLNEGDKEIIHLRFLAQLEYNEIAKVLDKKEGAIRVMLHRAQKKLKEEINKKSAS